MDTVKGNRENTSEQIAHSFVLPFLLRVRVPVKWLHFHWIGHKTADPLSSYSWVLWASPRSQALSAQNRGQTTTCHSRDTINPHIIISSSIGIQMNRLTPTPPSKSAVFNLVLQTKLATWFCWVKHKRFHKIQKRTFYNVSPLGKTSEEKKKKTWKEKVV